MNTFGSRRVDEAAANSSIVLPRTREQWAFSVLLGGAAVACAWGGVILPVAFLSAYGALTLSVAELRRTDAGVLQVWRRLGFLRLKVMNLSGDVTVSVVDRSYSKREASYHVIIAGGGTSSVIHRSSNAGDAYSMAKDVELFCCARSDLCRRKHTPLE
jgi:hypothetical protein